MSVMKTSLAMGIALIASVPQPSCTQELAPYSDFQGLSSTELETLQGKLTPVGNRLRSMYTLAFGAAGHPLDLSVFRPYYRPEFQGGYTTDLRKPQTFTASTQELAAIIDNVATLGEVTDGGIDAGAGFSFSLAVIKNGTTRVFESVLDTTNAQLLYGRMLGALPENASAREVIANHACSFGLLPGPKAADVTPQVSIATRGFRKDRSSGQYVGNVRVTNTGDQAIPSPIILAFRLGEGISLTSGSGFTCSLSPRGAPFQVLQAAGSLGAGQHIDATLRFENPDNDPIELLGKRVYAGPGFH